MGSDWYQAGRGSVPPAEKGTPPPTAAFPQSLCGALGLGLCWEKGQEAEKNHHGWKRPVRSMGPAITH